jgi:hypothetical protein
MLEKYTESAGIDPDPNMTRKRIPRLSKSRFMSGRQCHKRLYLELYDPDLAGSAGEFTQSALDTGHRIGAQARDRYPAGTLISHDHLDHAGAELATRSALGDPAVPAIYEGAFSFDRVGVRADILTRTRDRRFDLIEVKSTLDVKPEHEWDVAVQLYVLEGAGIPVRWARLMHLNRDYVYPGDDYDLKQLFTFTNLTRRARKRRSDTVAALKEIRKALAGKSPPPIPTGPHCSKPYACPFHEHCHQGEPDHSIDQLPWLRERLREQLVSMGIIDIKKIPPDFEGLSSLQSRVAQAVRTGRRFHDPAISKKLAKAKFPIHFVDFETFSPALPLYPGTSPYQMIPFQWSDHILNADGSLFHREFLHTGRNDPRRPFAEILLETVGRKGSIITYGTFEATRLKDLAELFPDLAPALDRARKRIIDLLPHIRGHIYDPQFHGSFSIKSVLPALVPELGYDDLEIAEGNAASLAYAEIQDPGTSPERIAELRDALLAYCKRDTQAMVELFKLLL